MTILPLLSMYPYPSLPGTLTTASPSGVFGNVGQDDYPVTQSNMPKVTGGPGGRYRIIRSSDGDYVWDLEADRPSKTHSIGEGDTIVKTPRARVVR